MFTLIPPVIPGKIVDNAGKVAAVHPAVSSAIAIPIPIKTSRINHFIRRAFVQLDVNVDLGAVKQSVKIIN